VEPSQPKERGVPLATALDLTGIAVSVVEEHRAAPCACVAAAVHTGDGWRFGAGAYGRLWPAAYAPRVSLATVFDLASVTKPVTALAMARLTRRGILRRDEPLAASLPELAGSRSANVPLDLFAAHRAGLDGPRPL
jgi:CubicO group peptidase (beta-lactamase class C family)